MDEIMMAVTTEGVLIGFCRGHVTDWSVNRVAMDSDTDPCLEVVLGRGETDALTQRAFFNGVEAERVAEWMIVHLTGKGTLSAPVLSWSEIGVHGPRVSRRLAHIE